jgi:hypothetical protein
VADAGFWDAFSHRNEGAMNGPNLSYGKKLDYIPPIRLILGRFPPPGQGAAKVSYIHSPGTFSHDEGLKCCELARLAAMDRLGIITAK